MTTDRDLTKIRRVLGSALARLAVLEEDLADHRAAHDAAEALADQDAADDALYTLTCCGEAQLRAYEDGRQFDAACEKRETARVAPGAPAPDVLDVMLRYKIGFDIWPEKGWYAFSYISATPLRHPGYYPTPREAFEVICAQIEKTKARA